MAISYPLSLPASRFVRTAFRARSVVGMSASPFSVAQQVYAWPGDCWMADVQLPPMKRANAEPWVAFLLALNGVEGTFLMGDVVNTTPRGVGTGTPLVKGASQTGKTLETDGWTAGQSPILAAGDWFQLGTGSTSRLHKLVQNANSDGSGNATLEIWPRLRSSPADNAALTLSSPKGLWRLTSNVREWSLELAQIYGISFSCMEAL
jgi:hypothetical protein